MNGKSVMSQSGILLGIMVIAAIAIMISNPGPDENEPVIDGPAIEVLVMALADGDTMLAAEPQLPEESSALAALEEAALQHTVPLGIKAYPFGKLVVSIGGVTAGPEGDWTYRVNDTMVPVAANSMHLQDGDRLVFQFGSGDADSLASGTGE